MCKMFQRLIVVRSIILASVCCIVMVEKHQLTGKTFFSSLLLPWLDNKNLIPLLQFSSATFSTSLVPFETLPPAAWWPLLSPNFEKITISVCRPGCSVTITLMMMMICWGVGAVHELWHDVYRNWEHYCRVVLCWYTVQSLEISQLK